MAERKDLLGQRFGRLKVVAYAGTSKHKTALWLCSCDCGATRIVLSSSLLSGATKSCGCLHREKLAEHSRNSTKHGYCKTGQVHPLYQTWSNMIQRCENQKIPGFYNYGGRGIRVCERWRTSFANFLEDMGDKPADTSLDRIDPNGNYEPTNCRWADSSVQHRNRRVIEGKQFDELAALIRDMLGTAPEAYRQQYLRKWQGIVSA